MSNGNAYNDFVALWLLAAYRFVDFQILHVKKRLIFGKFKCEIRKSMHVAILGREVQLILFSMIAGWRLL